MSPLLQSRLLATSGLGAGVVRYRPLEPVREIVEATMRDDVRVARTEVAVARLRAIAGAVGGLENQADHPRWPPSRPSSATCATGSPGWSAPRRASTWRWPWPCRWRRSAWGQKAQGWIDEHLGAGRRAGSAAVEARRSLAQGGRAGLLLGYHGHPSGPRGGGGHHLREYEEWKVWLGLRGRVALARMWGGDVAAGAAMLEDPELLAVVRNVRDPWVGAQLERGRAMFLAGAASSRRRSTCCRW